MRDSDDHYYIRTGEDQEQLLHKVSNEENKIVKIISFDEEYRGSPLYFEPVIEIAAELFG